MKKETLTHTGAVHGGIHSYLAALGAITAMLVLRGLLSPAFGMARPYTTLYAAVAFAVWFSRWKPAAVAAAVAFIAANYFFVEPRYAFVAGKFAVIDFL